MPERSRWTAWLLISLSVALIAGGTYLIAAGRAIRMRVVEGTDDEIEVYTEPTREEVDAAIARGTRAFIEDHVRPSWEAVSNGGYIDYTDAMGETHRYGPDAYVQSQLYLLTHFLMYSRDFGVPDDDPLLIKVRAWFLDQFDAEEGRWLWSEETCLHPKGMIALARIGRADLVDKAWAWAKQPPLWRERSKMFSIMTSGKIIQTVGPAEMSLTGRMSWEYQDPIPDAEYSTKFLYAVLAAGHTIDEPEVAELYDGIDRYFSERPLVFGEIHVGHVMGMAWFILAHHEFDLPGGPGYEISVKTVREGMRSAGVLRSFELSRRFMGTRGMVLKAALLEGVRSEGVHREAAYILGRQSESGSWLTAKRAWRLDRKPVVGIRLGQMNGSNTYLSALGLMAYRDLIFKPPAE